MKAAKAVAHPLSGALLKQISARWAPEQVAWCREDLIEAHMEDNLGAMRGRLPDPEQRKRMIAFLGSL